MVCHFSTFRTKLLNRYEEGSTLAGVIYVHPVSDSLSQGISGQNFDMFSKLCGESTLKDVVFVTNMWEAGSEVTNEARERALSGGSLKPALDKGAQMVRHRNTTESAHDTIRKITKNHSVVLQIQRELVDEHKNFIDTTAGKSLNKYLEKKLLENQIMLDQLNQEPTPPPGRAEEGMLERLERATEIVVREIMGEMKKISASYAAEKKRVRAKVKEMEQEAKQRGKWPEAEWDRKLATLSGRLRTAGGYAADRARWEEEIKRLQDRVSIPIY